MQPVACRVVEAHLRPDASPSVLEQVGAEGPADQAVPSADAVETGDLAVPCRHLVQAGDCGVDPQAAAAVEQQSDDHRVPQAATLGGGHRPQRAPARGNVMQARHAADPQALIGRRRQRVDLAGKGARTVEPDAHGHAGIGLQQVEAVLRGHPQGAIGAPEQAVGAPRIVRHAAQQAPIRAVLVEHAIGTEPHRAVGRLRHRFGAHRRCRRRALRGRGRGQRGVHVEFAVHHRHTCRVRGGPDGAAVELKQVPDIGLGEGVARARVHAADPDAAVAGVVPLQAGAQTTHPDPARSVDQQRRDLAGAQAGWLVRVVAQVAQAAAVARIVQCNTGLAPDPEGTILWLREAGDPAPLAGRRLGKQRHCTAYGIDHCEIAPLRADPDAPVSRLEQPLHLLAVQRMRRGERQRLEAVAAGATPAQALPAADPQRALSVNQQGLHAVVGQTARALAAAVLGGAAGDRVVGEHACAQRAGPDGAVAAFCQCVDAGCHRARLAGVPVGVAAAPQRDAAGERVVYREPVRFGRDPDPAVAGREQRTHPAHVAFGSVRALALLQPEVVAVEAHEPVAGGHPQEAGAVLRQGGDHIAGNDVGTDGLEARFDRAVGRWLKQRLRGRACGRSRARGHQRQQQGRTTTRPAPAAQRRRLRGPQKRRHGGEAESAEVQRRAQT